MIRGRGLADRLGGAVQANLLHSPGDADALVAAGVHVRLVKGAYVEFAGVHAYGERPRLAAAGAGQGSSTGASCGMRGERKTRMAHRGPVAAASRPSAVISSQANISAKAT